MSRTQNQTQTLSRKIFSVCLFNLILCCLPSPQALSYPAPVDFSGRLARWDVSQSSPEVYYQVNFDTISDQSDYSSTFSDAIDMWNEVDQSYVRLVPFVSGTSPVEKPQVTVSLKNSIEGGSFSAGFAIFDEFDDDGKVLHCTIEVLIVASYTATAKTILHELGHCLGLGHSLIPEAIMSYSLDENSFRIDVDDAAALSRLYPADGSPPDLPPGCSILTQPLSTTSNSTAILVLILPLGLGILRSSRNKTARGYSSVG